MYSIAIALYISKVSAKVPFHIRQELNDKERKV